MTIKAKLFAVVPLHPDKDKNTRMVEAALRSFQSRYSIYHKPNVQSVEVKPWGEKTQAISFTAIARNHAHAEEMQAFLDQLLKKQAFRPTRDVPVIGFILRAYNSWNIRERFAELKKSFSAWRNERITVKSSELNNDNEYDLLFLQKKGFVRARGTGQSITQIYGKIENLTPKSLVVVIKPGTYFVAQGNYQNMATRREYSVYLPSNSIKQVAIDATCINAGLPIPEEKNHFYGVKKVSDELIWFIFFSNNLNSMAVQAGVWALTDNYSAADVKERLVLRDRSGNTQRAISDEDIDSAAQMLDSLGIKHSLSNNNPNPMDPKLLGQIGLRYLEGDGIEQNTRKAKKWLQQAAKAGSPDAMYLVGHLYSLRKPNKWNFKKKFKWYKMAADNGSVDAMFDIGNCYIKGEGVKKDSSHAFKWFQKAADNGFEGAMYNIGRCLSTGDGVRKDNNQAIQWFRKAADKGFVEAMNGLAWIYISDIEFRDPETALLLAEKCVQHSKKNAEFLDTLACAYAENGKFSKAVEKEKEAIELAHSNELRAEFKMRLSAFEKGLTYLESEAEQSA